MAVAAISGDVAISRNKRRARRAVGRWRRADRQVVRPLACLTCVLLGPRLGVAAMTCSAVRDADGNETGGRLWTDEPHQRQLRCQRLCHHLAW